MITLPEGLKAKQPSIPEEIASMKKHQDLKYNIIFEQIVPFTQELAIKMLELPSFKGERQCNPTWVAHLIGEAKRGAWLKEQASLIICYCEYDQTIRRLNGQHTCWMRLELPEKWDMSIRHIKYEVKTEDDFRKLYTIIDRAKARTSAHIINARLIGLECLPGIAMSYIICLAKGYRMYCGKESITADSIADLMSGEDNKLICKVAAYLQEKSILSGGATDCMRRAPVYGALLATFKKSPDTAPEFWDHVSDGLDLTTKDDPRYRLREYLLRAVIKRHGDSLPDQKRVTSEEVYRACILAWNCFRRKEPLHIIKVGGLKKRPNIK